jgi:hypothetical protein
MSRHARRPRDLHTVPPTLDDGAADLLQPVQELKALVHSLDAALRSIEVFAAERSRMAPAPLDAFALVPAANEFVSAFAVHFGRTVSEVVTAVTAFAHAHPESDEARANLSAMRECVGLATKIPRDFYRNVLDTPGLPKGLRLVVQGIVASLDEIPAV